MGRATASGEPASNKRDAVLAAAIRCFAAHGLAGTGMRDIAREAGLTEGTLYHYFDSKDALIEVAFGWSAFQPADVRAAMERPGAPLRDRLLTVAGEFLAALRRNPDWSRVVIREAMRAAPADHANPVRHALIPLAAERIRNLAVALRVEQTSGRIGPCDPRRVAEHVFHALLGNFVAEAIAGRSAPPRGGADPFARHLVDVVARSLEPEPKPPLPAAAPERRPPASPGRRRGGRRSGGK
jgi:AcrR family transcriptional regulator